MAMFGDLSGACARTDVVGASSVVCQARVLSGHVRQAVPCFLLCMRSPALFCTVPACASSGPDLPYPGFTLPHTTGALCRLFLSSGGAWEQLASCHSLPRLLCSGDCDQFTDVGALRTAVRRAREAGAAAAVGDTGHQGSASAAGTQVHGAADATAGLGWRQEASGQQAGPQGRAPLDLAVWPGCDHFFYTGNTGPEEDVDRGPGAGGRQWTGKGPEGGGGAVGHSVGRGSLRPWHAVAGYVVQWAMQHVRTEYGEGGGLLDRPDERRC